jgi:RNA polymerase sigma-70 factor (ECF subfamily)
VFGLTEASIVKKAQKGDSSAVGWLFDNHHEAIFRFIWLRVRDHALAEDLTGEVFMRMVAELPRYQNRDLPFRAWLYRIAHNLVIDNYRTDKSHMSLPLEQVILHANPATHPDVMTDQALTIERVQQALDNLDPAQREVVELRFLAGLSLKDAAATLNKTVAAVKSLQHRGLSTLRILLTETPHPSATITFTPSESVP